MSAPFCPRCGGAFGCVQCEYPLRKMVAARDAVKTTQRIVVTAPEVQRYLANFAVLNAYQTSFPVGPRGGAMIDFGQQVQLECFLPYIDDETGEVLPFMPMPLDGSPVHDLTRSNESSCRSGTCSCDRPTGWFLTRPILRILLGVGDAYLNEHSRQLPGRLPTWELRVATVPFMTDCFWNNVFRFPTRAATRDERRARKANCNRSHKPPSPRQRGRRR